MQIPILSGIAADVSPEFRTTYPLNLKPIPKTQGISQGYLRIAEGLVEDGQGPGRSRGGIVWDGVLYRVMGTKLVSIASDDTVTVLGDVGGSGLVSMTYSFDRLAIASAGNLFYWDKSTLVQVTDPDLGVALDVEWADGYFVTTDGEFIVVTELNDPTAVDPLKYGSSEVDPDPINSIQKVRNEIFAVNRYSIEAYSNVGGSGFPFQVIRGAQVHKGAVGTYAAAVFNDTIAVVGGGRNESIGIHLCTNGSSSKISTREIDTVLSGYTEAQLSEVQVEVVEDRNNSTLMVHLPDRTMCFDASATSATGQPVWYFLASGAAGDEAYRGRHFEWAYNAWRAADLNTPAFGRMSYDDARQWGDLARWEFGLPVIYNGAKGATVHSLELVGTFGQTEFGTVPVVSAEWSSDGVTWSQPYSVPAGVRGDRVLRLRWLRQGIMRNMRVYRFRGDTNTPMSIAACEAEIEGLAW